jgi:hypothetical protein
MGAMHASPNRIDMHFDLSLGSIIGLKPAAVRLQQGKSKWLVSAIGMPESQVGEWFDLVRTFG